MPHGEYLIQILLDSPGRPHPPRRHLVDDHITLGYLFDFLCNVIAVIHNSRAYRVTESCEMLCRDLRELMIELAFRKQEAFSAINDQYFAHDVSL